MPEVIEHTVFAEGRLSIGLTLPMLSSGNAVADFDEQIALARLADELGFAALWVRDVPLNSSDYPDPVGHLDPWVLLGAVASHTKNIALASGAIVLTLRHPLHIAKGAISVNTLSRGRFILGLGSAIVRMNTRRFALMRTSGGRCIGGIGIRSRPRLAANQGSFRTSRRRTRPNSSCYQHRRHPFR